MTKVRLYFNAKADAPLCWSVDEGDISSEKNVKEIHVLIPMVTVFAGEDSPQPRAWLEGWGKILIRDDEAYLVSS
jgi:hypothetical protein